MGLNHKENFEHTTEQDRVGHTCEAFPEPKFVSFVCMLDFLLVREKQCYPCIIFNPFTPKISLVILLTVCNHYDVRSENLILDQLVIPSLLFFFILYTHLLIIVMIL